MTGAGPTVAVVDCQPSDLERLTRLRAALPTAIGEGPCGGDELVARAAGATVLATLYTYTKVDAAVLERLPDLRLVITRTAGHSHIDAEAARRRGVAVATVPDAPTEAVAEYTIAALLALRRNLLPAVASTAAGAWAFTDFRGRELRGSTLGVIGLGRIGTRVAELASAIGMDVLGWSRSPKRLAGVEQVPLDELLDRSDAVSVNLPLAPETHGLLSAERLARLPRGAQVVNTARGEVVDLEALCALLRDGHLGGACLDVLEGEPVAAEVLAPLADVPNLLVTPHVSWHTHETLDRQFGGLTDRIVAFAAGDPIETIPAPVDQEQPV